MREYDEGTKKSMVAQICPSASQQPLPRACAAYGRQGPVSKLSRSGLQQRTDGSETRHSSARHRRDALWSSQQSSVFLLLTITVYADSGCTVKADGCWRSLLQGWSAEGWVIGVLHSVHMSAGVRQRVSRRDGKCTMVDGFTSRAACFNAWTLRAHL